MINPSEVPLAQEAATFQIHKAELLGRHRGGYALIHGETVLGTFDTQGDAISVGYHELGNVSFLTKQIVEVEVPARFTRDIFPSSQIVYIAPTVGE